MSDETFLIVCAVGLFLVSMFLFAGSPDLTDAIICNLMETCDEFVKEE